MHAPKAFTARGQATYVMAAQCGHAAKAWHACLHSPKAMAAPMGMQPRLRQPL